MDVFRSVLMKLPTPVTYRLPHNEHLMALSAGKGCDQVTSKRSKVILTVPFERSTQFCCLSSGNERMSRPLCRTTSSHKNFTLVDVQRRKDSERRKRWHRGSHGVAVENRLRPKTPNRSSLATHARLTYLQSRGGKEVAAISPGIEIKSDCRKGILAFCVS
ncbi:hypothetical protein CDAR_311091 [Caerostris darwini]|uniref:Uncharacterized protein n=1 Tax=Caerostris darwini TaxID=1538125 RepID=A0AAV4WWL1_9ARAC|nr:hypothetical protein CDAR_311091 [Caerostris darwini]